MTARRCLCWRRRYPRPTVLRCSDPSTSGRRCQGLRRCGIRQQTPQQPFGPCRGRSLWRKVLLCTSNMYELFHHRLTVRTYRTPNTSGRRCQGWRKRGNGQQTPQRPFGPHRGQSRWMKVRWCSCWCSHRRPTFHSRRRPRTSGRRCQGWRRWWSLQ